MGLVSSLLVFLVQHGGLMKKSEICVKKGKSREPWAHLRVKRNFGVAGGFSEDVKTRI